MNFPVDLLTLFCSKKWQMVNLLTNLCCLRLCSSRYKSAGQYYITFPFSSKPKANAKQDQIQCYRKIKHKRFLTNVYVWYDYSLRCGVAQFITEEQEAQGCEQRLYPRNPWTQYPDCCKEYIWCPTAGAVS